MPFDLAQQTPRDPVLQVLTGARVFVARGWCHGAQARDARGHSVAFDSPAAVAFCISGAVRRAGVAYPRGTMGALLILSLLTEPSIVSEHNDRLPRVEDAVAVLDGAIDYRRAQAAPAPVLSGAEG